MPALRSSDSAQRPTSLHSNRNDRAYTRKRTGEKLRRDSTRIQVIPTRIRRDTSYRKGTHAKKRRQCSLHFPLDSANTHQAYLSKARNTQQDRAYRVRKSAYGKARLTENDVRHDSLPASLGRPCLTGLEPSPRNMTQITQMDADLGRCPFLLAAPCSTEN